MFCSFYFLRARETFPDLQACTECNTPNYVSFFGPPTPTHPPLPYWPTVELSRKLSALTDSCQSHLTVRALGLYSTVPPPTVLAAAAALARRVKNKHAPETLSKLGRESVVNIHITVRMDMYIYIYIFYRLSLPVSKETTTEQPKGTKKINNFFLH